MSKIETKYRYSRNIKLSLIASLIIIIVCFEYFPNFSQNENKILFTGMNLTSFINIPVTTQNYPASSFLKPKTPAIIYTQSLVEPEMLNDVAVNTPNEISDKNFDNSKINGLTKGSSDKIEQLPFKPRQIFEVVPQKNEDVNGTISLSLKIDTLGKVVNYIILKSTIVNKNCINNVISAASKSRWQPAEINGKKVEYWVEKSYTFN